MIDIWAVSRDLDPARDLCRGRGHGHGRGHDHDHDRVRVRGRVRDHGHDLFLCPSPDLCLSPFLYLSTETASVTDCGNTI